MCQWSRNRNIDLDLSFAFNQTSNIFYFKILYASFSVSGFSYINLDIPSHTSALAFSRVEVLQILQS